jgi:hypothetical protein
MVPCEGNLTLEDISLGKACGSEPRKKTASATARAAAKAPRRTPSGLDTPGAPCLQRMATCIPAERGLRASWRKPMLLLRLLGVLVLRADSRRLSSLLLNEPPRTPRDPPPGSARPGPRSGHRRRLERAEYGSATHLVARLFSVRGEPPATEPALTHAPGVRLPRVGLPFR